MFLVVVNYPEDGLREFGPFTTRQEAEWRADYERRCAEYLWGCEARADIGSRIEAVAVKPTRRRKPFYHARFKVEPAVA